MGLQVSFQPFIDRESLGVVLLLQLGRVEDAFELQHERISARQLKNLGKELLNVAASLVTLPMRRKEAMVADASVIRGSLEELDVNVSNPESLLDGVCKRGVLCVELPSDFLEELVECLALALRAAIEKATLVPERAIQHRKHKLIHL